MITSSKRWYADGKRKERKNKMETYEIEDFLYSSKAYSIHTSQEIFEHFAKKYNSVPYQKEVLFIFDHERSFADKNHKIELHARNNGIVPYHIFHYIVITYCYEGEMHFYIEGEPVTLKKGDLIIFDRHVPHKVMETTEKDLGINMILSDQFFIKNSIRYPHGQAHYPQFLSEVMNRTVSHIHYLIVQTKDDRLVKQCIQNILKETIDPMMASDEIIDQFIAILLTHLARLDVYQTNLKLHQHKHQQLLDEIFSYIEDDYVEGNLSEMADHFGYDASYISKLIKQGSNKTFKELVNEERMKSACIPLNNEALPIYEVAEQVGISNLTTFYKRVQTYYGLTPKQYREQTK